MSISLTAVDNNGSLDLTTSNGLSSIGRSAERFGLTSTYIEPVNLGWRAPQFEAVAAFGVFAPTGSYEPTRMVNTGLGRWAEMFSLGGTAYSDAARTWSLALEGRYLIHQPQQGVDLRAGDDFIIEGGAGRKFHTAIGPVNVGVDGYAYWQVSDLTSSAAPAALNGLRGRVYAVGPEVTATTKYGRCYVRLFSEFDGRNTPQGHELLAGVGLAF